MPYVQDNQPEGVPPLQLTGERTLPDVPEENYWYRRHLAVYEWIAARCAGLRVADLACGEGYGSDVLARAAADVVGVDANPEAHEHAKLRYRRPNLRFERALVEEFAEPRDAIVFLQTIEHVQEPAELLRGFARLAPVSYVSTPNRLTLAPPGAEKSDNPWHLREYTLDEYRELLEPCFAASRSSASSTPASCAPTSWRSSSAGTASTRPRTSPSPSTTASSASRSDFVPAISAALDFSPSAISVGSGEPAGRAET